MQNQTLDSQQYTKPINFIHCLKVGNTMIVLSMLLVISCIAITFFLEQHFSLGAQVAAHIGTIVFAAILKLGYVIRCIGAQGLGHKAF